jgi:hypothetical protein
MDMIRECMICHRHFWNPDGFYRCWICLKENRNWDLTKGDKLLNEQMTHFDQLYRQHMVLLKEKSEPKVEKKIVKKILRLDDLAKDRVKKLLLLCHPDRHSKRMEDSAREITQWLLGIKSKMKK